MFNPDNPPRSICILRLSALGDVTHVVPLLRALQQAWPETRVTWVCGSVEHRLLSCIPGVRFIVFNKRDGLQGMRAVHRALRGERFDILLQMQIALRANLLSLFISARVRLGWDRESSRDLHQWVVNTRLEPLGRRHQVQNFLAFARAFGIDAAEPAWDWPLAAEGRAFAATRLAADRRTLLISPSASTADKEWSAERYAAVADHAAGELGMQVILSGSASAREVAMAASIEERMHTPPLNLAGKVRLEDLASLLAAADVVLSPDSGPAHIANAVGTPVIGLYACTNPRRSGPYGSLELCVDRFPEALSRFEGKQPGDVPWRKYVRHPDAMDLIEVDDVKERLQAALATPGPGGGML